MVLVGAASGLLRTVASSQCPRCAQGARAGGNSGIVARALDARFGQWDGSQRVEVQVVDSIRHAGPHAVFVGRSGEAFQCSSEGPGTLRSVLPALVGDEAVANARSLVEEVLSRGCVNAVRARSRVAAVAAECSRFASFPDARHPPPVCPF